MIPITMVTKPGYLRFAWSALVNIRRKALGHLMKFTQGRLKYI